MSYICAMNPLAIAFDAKRAVANNTGLGNYSRLVVDVMSQYFPENSYTLYAPRISDTSRIEFLAKRGNTHLVGPDSALWRHASALWRVRGGVTRQIMNDGIRLFHGLSNELPLDIARARIPSVVTIHDLIFKRLPLGYKPIDRRIYDYKFRHAAIAATRVIAISKRTGHDLTELYGIPPQKIDIVYQGCNPVFTRPVDSDFRDNVCKQLQLPPVFIAVVGTVEPRKNQLLAVKALPLLPEDVNLVIIGRGRMGYDREIAREVSRLRLTRRVKMISYVESRYLPAVYSLAAIAAYPSRYEGFGIPVIEAINCGTPVIAATGSCLEEAGGPGAVYVDPDSPEEFAAEAIKILDSAETRAEMAENGRKYVSRFNRRAFADGIMASYLKAIEHFDKSYPECTRLGTPSPYVCVRKFLGL